MKNIFLLQTFSVTLFRIEIIHADVYLFIYLFIYYFLLQVMQLSLNRCVSVLSQSTATTDVTVQVCTHVARCFSVAAQFESCREKITEIPTIVKDLCGILYFKVNISFRIIFTIC